MNRYESAILLLFVLLAFAILDALYTLQSFTLKSRYVVLKVVEGVEAVNQTEKDENDA